MKLMSSSFRLRCEFHWKIEIKISAILGVFNEECFECHLSNEIILIFKSSVVHFVFAMVIPNLGLNVKNLLICSCPVFVRKRLQQTLWAQIIYCRTRHLNKGCHLG